MNKKIETIFVDNRGYFNLLSENTKIGEMSFVLSDNIMKIDHTEINELYKGKGLAKILFNHAVDFARKNNYKIIPICSYVVNAFEKDESLSDLLIK